MSDSRLFQPMAVGNLKLSHRMAMCPLTRFRASDDHVPLPCMKDYYGQRASVPGTLIISEGTFIAAAHGGYANVPGIYSEEQIKAWRKITDEVHAKGGYIFCQLWALGRTADAEVAKKEGITFISSSTIPVDSEHPEPIELSVKQIQEVISDYRQAAMNAIKAGFDGVEIHGANGYLVDQFIQDKCNQRTDEYGGSIKKRSRFAIEVIQAVSEAIGGERTAIRLSPWSTYNGMRMDEPIPQFSDIVQNLGKFNLAYLHLVESRIAGNADVESSDRLHFAIQIWQGPLFIAGGFRPESARRLVDEEYPDKDIVVMFGRFFISTPDLPFRIKFGLDLNPYNRDTFYTPKAIEGYTDYPFSREFLTSSKAQEASLRAV